MKNINHYMAICDEIAKMSKCLSIQRGSLIITPDFTIVGLGYNGPPRGVPHCDSDERLNWLCDKLKSSHVGDIRSYLVENGWGSSCPRRTLKYKSGEGLDICPAGHSEANAIYNAARHGISIRGCYLIHSTALPCVECSKAIIGAGITKVICRDLPDYDTGSRWLLKQAGIEIIQID